MYTYIVLNSGPATWPVLFKTSTLFIQLYCTPYYSWRLWGTGWVCVGSSCQWSLVCKKWQNTWMSSGSAFKMTKNIHKIITLTVSCQEASPVHPKAVQDPHGQNYSPS